MSGLRLTNDLDEGHHAWRQAVPAEKITDLWEVRECFQRHFNHDPLFVLWREQGRLVGFLPLSWIEEQGYYAFFPGETHKGRTWLEQNRVLAADRGMLEDMLQACGAPFQLRYLNQVPTLGDGPEVDETGYLFHPARYGYDVAAFLAQLPGKFRRNMMSDIRRLSDGRVSYRLGRLEDFELMVLMNVGAFGGNSYFGDRRFASAFRDLARWLYEREMLRIVTVLIDGQPAAVDMGSVYRGVYTVLAGGVSPAQPGVAKLINLHHLEFACQNRLAEVDFLCGDFNWKSRLGLEPRPLFALGGNGPCFGLASMGLERPLGVVGAQ